MYYHNIVNGNVYVRSFISSIPNLLGGLVLAIKSCPPCPCCLPKYAYILSFFGLELSEYSHYFLPIMFLSMIYINLSSFYYFRVYRLSILPFLIICFSSLVILLQKFYFHSEEWSYVSLGILFVGIIFGEISKDKNLKLKAKAKNNCCANHDNIA